MKKPNTMVNFSSLVLFFLLFVTSSYASKVVEVSAICNHTNNPSFCSTLLNSKAGSDLVTLAQYTIDVVHANVTNTINLINSLIAKSGGDPKAKEHYKQCLKFFGSNEGALGQVEYIQERLKLGDYQGVNVAASAIVTYVDDCVSGDSPSDPPYHDTSLLPKYADVIEQVADIILVISNDLINN